MFCTKCGNEINPGAKFCGKCGTAVRIPVSPVLKNENANISQPEAVEQTPVKKKKSGNGLVIVLICLIVLIVALIATILGIYYYQQNMEATRIEEDEDTEDTVEDDEPDAIDEEAEAGVTETDPAAVDEDAVAEANESIYPETPVAEEAVEEEDEAIHTYQIVTADVTWTEAFRGAKGFEGGRLVNINSQEEMDFITQMLEAEGYEDYIIWIGMRRDIDSDEYYWVNEYGELKGTETNDNPYWLTNEPTFYDDMNDLDELYVEMFYSSSQEQWVWNDVPDDILALVPHFEGKVAYIVEITE